MDLRAALERIPELHRFPTVDEMRADLVDLAAAHPDLVESAASAPHGRASRWSWPSSATARAPRSSSAGRTPTSRSAP
ncbi:hypothetical protein [Allokutzneria albata]|uniref:hypothetical protein n=1 Tax=Allokutzneria albata TaxID=211114 RepID=UPI0012DBE6E5|nr:hypothetical protein [Allokutzneria albata]